jgi:hypothetical protein
VTAGTWQTTGDDVQMTLNGMTLQVTLNEDKSDSYIPRLHLFVKETTTAITKAHGEGYALANIATSEPVTFLYGEDAATNYWAGNFAYAYTGESITYVSALSKSHHNNNRDPIDCTSGTCEEDIELMDFDVEFSQSCQSLGFPLISSDSNVSNHNVKYSFSLVNEKFEANKLTITNFEAKELNNKCLVDFDFGENEDLHQIMAADNVVLFAHSSDANFEDFAISTYVDRDLTIQPKVSLDLSTQETSFVELDKGYMSIEDVENSAPVDTQAKLYELVVNGEELVHTSNYYEVIEIGPNKGSYAWDMFDYTQTSALFPYAALNGENLYQVWELDSYFNPTDPENPNQESSGSYTIWTDVADQISISPAGYRSGLTQMKQTYDTFSNKLDAQKYVEELFAQEISFVGTTWMSEDDGETVTYTYTQSGSIITFGNEVEELSWDEYPSDLPCLVEDDHTCSFAEMNAIYEWNDVYDNGWVSNHFIEWTWNPNVNADVFYRVKDKGEPETMIRVED